LLKKCGSIAAGLLIKPIFNSWALAIPGPKTTSKARLNTPRPARNFRMNGHRFIDLFLECVKNQTLISQTILSDAAKQRMIQALLI